MLLQYYRLMETGKVNSRLLYPKGGMVDMSVDTHVQQQKWNKSQKKPAVEWIAFSVNCIE